MSYSKLVVGLRCVADRMDVESTVAKEIAYESKAALALKMSEG